VRLHAQGKLFWVENRNIQRQWIQGSDWGIMGRSGRGALALIQNGILEHCPQITFVNLDIEIRYILEQLEKAVLVPVHGLRDRWKFEGQTPALLGRWKHSYIQYCRLKIDCKNWMHVHMPGTSAAFTTAWCAWNVSLWSISSVSVAACRLLSTVPNSRDQILAMPVWLTPNSRTGGVPRVGKHTVSQEKDRSKSRR